MSDWIIDRPPTEADADRDGDVAVKKRPGPDAFAYFHWSFVKPGMVWRRTSHWYAEQTPEPAVSATQPPATQPRRFVSISRTFLSPTESIIDAIDDEGVAWTRKSLPIPPQPSWKRIDPLPAREVPPF